MIVLDTDEEILYETYDDDEYDIEAPLDLETFVSPVTEERQDPLYGLAIQSRALSAEATKWQSKAPCFGKFQWATENKAKISESTFIDSFCSRCDYIQPCLVLAICYMDEYHIWGGTKPSQRDKLIESIKEARGEDFFKYWKKDNLEILKAHVQEYLTPGVAETPVSLTIQE